jgi:hypothetical protein
MNPLKLFSPLAWVAIAAFLSTTSIRAGVEQVIAEMESAANHFLNALTPEEHQAATFEFGDPQRTDWHFIPKERKGLIWNQMSGEKKILAHALLASGLSTSGYIQSTTIMTLEKILQDLEGPDRRFPRDPELYHVSIFGKPSTDGTWGWSIEGHHLSLNFTITGGKSVSATPHFMGTNPALVKEGPRKGLQVLAHEEQMARALLHSLNPDQLKQAMIGDKAPADIFTAAQQEVTALDHKGIAASQLNWHQKEALLEIIETYLNHVRPEVAGESLDAIDQAGIGHIQFAWMGGKAEGEAHYYRIQGPTFLLEYDNVQNGANHVHAVWRDFKHDFGRDLLKQHYQQVPH